MSQTTHAPGLIRTAPRWPAARLALLAAIACGAVIGFTVTRGPAASQAVVNAGAELTRLLRAMALLKAALTAAAVIFIGWRLRFPINPKLAAAYIASAAVMAIAPGLIWDMAHVVLGALLLHSAGALMLVLFCRDPGSPAMAWAARRTRKPD